VNVGFISMIGAKERVIRMIGNKKESVIGAKIFGEELLHVD
jgi:hypothetical protein